MAFHARCRRKKKQVTRRAFPPHRTAAANPITKMAEEDQIVGIGCVLEPSPSGNLQVTRLVPGGPAQVQGGINVGDILMMVDGVDVSAMDLTRVAPLGMYARALVRTPLPA